jgi:hypothetical protein
MAAETKEVAVTVAKPPYQILGFAPPVVIFQNREYHLKKLTDEDLKVVGRKLADAGFIKIV